MSGLVEALRERARVEALRRGADERLAWMQRRFGKDEGGGQAWHPYRNGAHAWFTQFHAVGLADELGADAVEREVVRFAAVWHCHPEQSREALADSARRAAQGAGVNDPEVLEAIHRAVAHVRCAGDVTGEEDVQPDVAAARDGVEQRRWRILADAELANRVCHESGGQSVALVAERVLSWPLVDPSDRVDLAEFELSRAAVVAGLEAEIERIKRGFALDGASKKWGGSRRTTLGRLVELLGLHEGGASFADVVRATQSTGEGD
jgi:hypothetical protein